MWWFIYAALSSISWCCVTIFGKLASQRVDPSTVTVVRAILMTLMLTTGSILLKQFSLSTIAAIQARDWLFIILASVASSFAWLFYFSAFQHGLVTKVVSIDRLNFIFIMFLSAYLFGEELSWSMISGAILMVLGVVLIASS